ncbi:hypothetical protein BD324DRAFT_630719 [Kockovaella imperatae]|uniref:GST N-terminal domain-containing protein n=1 Tax=Kockovaella imperatae TaxID=4999 RepID=A0A1Y1UES9_9TREE|nr:hypothetical protein BD324DRAFT_630719 [Kockovaella imperatae]ORX35575.1 hypothetical protein BD324DRAFT_630719 [Kockovaella imperatae]
MSLTLYELTTRPGETVSFSPAVWITKLDLALLGIEHERKPITFSQIRSELVKSTGNDKVTVPTIHDDGSYVTDSWAIAERIDRDHKLFGSPAGKRYAKFVDLSKGAIARSLVPLVMPKVSARSCGSSKLTRGGGV